MDYHIKYLKYKTKYVNLKYDNNQYGGRNEFICVHDPDGKYPTYDTCNTISNVSFESNSSNADIETTLYGPIPEAYTSLSQMWKDYEKYEKYFVKIGNCFHCGRPVFSVDKDMNTKPYYDTVWKLQGITYQSKIHNNIIVFHTETKCIKEFLNDKKLH
jgi:hypothetical protein